MSRPSWVLGIFVAVALMIPDKAFSDTPEDGNVVKRNKGMESCSVMVGFLFHHQIPDDAFSGDVAEYQACEACDEGLPSWLEFNQSTKTFTGFPQAHHVDTRTFICIKAFGKSPDDGTPPSVAKDVFSVDVEVGLTSSYACPETDTVVVATIYADFSVRKLSKQEIFKVLNSMGAALDISPENIRFTKLVHRYDPEVHTVLFSGKGDSEGKQQTDGARIQFQVGCSSDTITEDHPLVQFLQSKAPTGELARIIGYPVMDWTVQNGFPRGKAHPE